MLQLAIISDDLTGALDAAAPLAGIAGGVAVATRPAALRAALASGASVVAVSTRSREIPATEARARVVAALAEIPAQTRILKKIDSRLKGNLEAELQPFAGRPLLVCPAIPDLGRVVINGDLQGRGVEQAIDIRRRLGQAAAAALIPDVRSLAELTAEVARADEGAVLVGARGMAQALAAVMGIRPVQVPPPLPKPLCIAVGSTDPITLRQAALLRHTRPDLLVVEAPAGSLSAPRQGQSSVTLLQAVPGPARSAAEVARIFASDAAPWLVQARSMVLTGGATAEALLDALNVDMLTVLGEILPGMPFCRSGEHIVVTKSGGFGDSDAFVHLAGSFGDKET